MKSTPALTDTPSEAGDHPPSSLVRGAWSSFVTAVRFLTRLPPGAGAAAKPAALQRCAVFFPLVGALIGVVTAGVLAAGGLLWPYWLAVLLALAAEAWLTGALHEDGLADFFDAFGGGWTREKVLEILKDSRVGTYGVVALVLAIGLRGGAMFELITQSGPGGWLVWGSAIVASAAIGRWVMVLAMVCTPPVPRRESLSQELGSQLGWRDLLLASCWCLPAIAPFAVLLPGQFLLAGLLLAGAVWLFTRSVRKRLGGITGDCLGCLCYISQVLVLLAAAAKI